TRLHRVVLTGVQRDRWAATTSSTLCVLRRRSSLWRFQYAGVNCSFKGPIPCSGIATVQPLPGSKVGDQRLAPQRTLEKRRATIGATAKFIDQENIVG